MTPPPPASGRFVGRLAGLGSRVLTRGTVRRLPPSADGLAEQEAVRAELVGRLAPTAFGRDHGLEQGLSEPEFRRRIAPRAYEGFAPYIERMKRGEPDVLHPGRCPYFAVSSGTTAGPSKWLPVNDPLLAHFRRAGLDSLAFHALRAGRDTVFRGRHLFLGGSTTLQALPDMRPTIRYGDLSGLTALNLPAWADRLLYEPGRDIAQIADWPAKLAAIAERTWRRDIRLVAGIPSWLLVLAARLREHAVAATGHAPSTLRDLWPNLECLVHGGVPVAPFADELRQVYGPGVQLHEVYPASEGFIAAQDAGPEAGLRLLTGHGIYYEFLPLEAYDELKPDGSRAVPLSGVRTGVDYVLLLTTPAGLVRYVIGDVVRFLSTTPPRLVYVGRTKLQLSAFGEHVIEKELTDSVAAVCRRAGIQLADFHVAPLFPDPAAGRDRGCHEWWIELRGDADRTAASEEVLAEELDRELTERNDDYAAKRTGGGLTAPRVHCVAPGFFEAWLRRAGKWGGQHKTPRCRSDRKIADELEAQGAAAGACRR